LGQGGKFPTFGTPPQGETKKPVGGGLEGEKTALGQEKNKNQGVLLKQRSPGKKKKRRGFPNSRGGKKTARKKGTQKKKERWFSYGRNSKQRGKVNLEKEGRRRIKVLLEREKRGRRKVGKPGKKERGGGLRKRRETCVPREGT